MHYRNVEAYKHFHIALFHISSVASIFKKYINILVIHHQTFLADLFCVRLSKSQTLLSMAEGTENDVVMWCMCNRRGTEWAGVGKTSPAGVDVWQWESQRRTSSENASKARLGRRVFQGWLTMITSSSMENSGSLHNSEDFSIGEGPL